MGVLRIILWDQLSFNLPTLLEVDKEKDILFFAETKAQTHQVPHHKKKLVFLLSAMRHFAKTLQKEGYRVSYITLDNDQNTQTLTGEIERFVQKHPPDSCVITEPSDYKTLKNLENFKTVPLQILEDTRFITSHKAFEQWASNRKALTMEYFYREVRKKTGLLMQEGKPEGGQWNFDKDNRKPLKAGLSIPEPLKFSPDAITKGVIELVQKICPEHFGEIEDFWFAVTRSQALESLHHFCDKALPFFGDYQDAMASKQPFLFHSFLSHYINNGLLNSMEVCETVEKAYRLGRVSINAAEGYIRQIIGWREYIRGIYWLNMPGYLDKNALSAALPVPSFYWTAKTDMHCLHQAVQMTREEAYSHHIQRLMITGNFALLAGLNPHEVHEWYLAVYADAHEWVEAPNTLGMALFADGGVVGTKPYIASGAYINRMSNFCKSCPYDVKDKFGEKACPFNFLYWDFLIRHRETFKTNHRMGIAYKNLEKLSLEDQKRITQKARSFLKELK